MKFEQKLHTGTFLKRYKRFFADVELDGETVVAHVPNTGSMKTCNEPQSQCRVTHVDNPERKLKYTLQMIKTPTSWVGVNTGIPNQLVFEAWQNQAVKSWKKFDCGKREVKIHAKTRFDMALWKSHPDISEKKPIPLETFNTHKFHFIEVKNVTFAQGKCAQFPDAVTERGRKHLRELVDLIKQGHTAELVFVIQRTDCTHFAPADDIDPEYGELLREGKEAGLIISPYACNLTATKIELLTDKKLKLKF